MESLSSAISSRSFDIVRRGYNPEQVDDFLADMADQVAEMEDELRSAAVSIATLRRQVEAPKEATAAVEAAYLAAADAKHKLLDAARERAAEIVAKAERDASIILSDPGRQADDHRHQAEEALLEARRRLEDAGAEADRILRQARAEAERLRTETQREALSAIAETHREAERMVENTRSEYESLVSQLLRLRQAVNSAFERGAAESEALRIVLGGATSRTDEAVAGR